MPQFTNHLEISQGATFRKAFVWKSGGAVVDITGYTAKSQIRTSVGSSTVVCEMTTENGMLEIDGPAGKVTVVIPATVTETFNFNSSGGVYDVELYHPHIAGEIMSLVGGMVKLTLQVTR